MGMAFLRLHNIKCAAECMERAFELVKTQEFLAPYMYVLELLGDHERDSDVDPSGRYPDGYQ